MPVFLSLKCRTFHKIILLMFLFTHFILLCILFWSCQSYSLWNTMNVLFINFMVIGCSRYNVIHYGKHENVLLDKCLLYLYFPPDWVGKYLYTYNNNVTHISSAVSHDVYSYRYTFFHVHVGRGIVNMATMRLYRILIVFKDTALYFTRPSVLRFVTSIFELFQIKIAPC